MTAMNETSTITLPECHNLLALLLLSLNAPSVSSSSTTQEEELKKKERRENTHTEPGARQQNGAGRQVPDPDKETDLTHKIHHQKKKQVLHQKRKTDKTSLPPRARKHKPYTREKNHTPKRKKKNHTTHSRLTSQHHPATPADTDPHPIPPTYFLPTSLPSPIPTPYPHTVHTPTDTLLPSPDHILPAATSSPPVSLLYAATLPPPACTLSATALMPVSVSLPLALNLCSAP